jgi:hypothetical protein
MQRRGAYSPSRRRAVPIGAPKETVSVADEVYRNRSPAPTIAIMATQPR